MIRFFLLQNRAGKTRLAKYYTPLSDDDKQRTEDEVHRLIATRDAKFTNFLEVRRAACLPCLPAWLAMHVRALCEVHAYLCSLP